MKSAVSGHICTLYFPPHEPVSISLLLTSSSSPPLTPASEIPSLPQLQRIELASHQQHILTSSFHHNLLTARKRGAQHASFITAFRNEEGADTSVSVNTNDQRCDRLLFKIGSFTGNHLLMLHVIRASAAEGLVTPT